METFPWGFAFIGFVLLGLLFAVLWEAANAPNASRDAAEEEAHASRL